MNPQLIVQLNIQVVSIVSLSLLQSMCVLCLFLHAYTSHGFLSGQHQDNANHKEEKGPPDQLIHVCILLLAVQLMRH